jgi:predicted RNA binding protein YcfA (HicA-like mRNA interferase family)
MSKKLPVVRGADLVRVLERTGWTQVHTRGSHVRMEREGHHVSIPLHNPVKRGTLATILADVGMSPDELRRLL